MSEYPYKPADCPTDHANADKTEIVWKQTLYEDATCKNCGIGLIANNNADPTPWSENP